MKYLISGTSSGLGRYLKEEFASDTITRLTTQKDLDRLSKFRFKAIIHCASNSNAKVTDRTIASFAADNIFLTQKLLQIPHEKFIFISTIDVYSRDTKEHRESDVISAHSARSPYALTKLISEGLVRSTSPNYLILRPGSLVGRYMKPNTLTKILSQKKPILGLSGNSAFHYIRYEDIASFLKYAMDKDLQGIYNVVTACRLRLKDAARLAGKDVRFGEHRYDAGNISNAKIAKIYPAFRKTSQEILSEVIKRGIRD